MALLNLEAETTIEMRVHLSHSPFELKNLTKAKRLFHLWRLDQTTNRNGILLCINLKKKTCTIIAGEGFAGKVDPGFWPTLGRYLRTDLQSTHYENAIEMVIQTIQTTFKPSFGRELN